MWASGNKQRPVADAVVMVRPVDFQFNVETAVDNVYQHSVTEDENSDVPNIKSAAMREFDAMVNQVRSCGINVMVLEAVADTNHIPTPDAVFPNNWFATSSDGRIFLFPMAVPSRIAERRPTDLRSLVESHGYRVDVVENVGAVQCPVNIELERTHAFEGTGAMVIDKANKCIFGALSARCDRATLEEFAASIGHSYVCFDTVGSKGAPVYHTNVVMSIGMNFAVVCFECIVPSDRDRVRAALTGKSIIEISLHQMEECFCGNVLELQSVDGKICIAMSKSAWNGFDVVQQELLSSFGDPIVCEIPIIERIGGGSVRCMLAEVFLPRA